MLSAQRILQRCKGGISHNPAQAITEEDAGAGVRDGVMYGRGVAVSKSDFATYVFALLALKIRGSL